MSDLFRIAIIGHTGRGNYGHYLDRAFEGVEGTEVVALADPDDEGRKAAIGHKLLAIGHKPLAMTMRIETNNREMNLDLHIKNKGDRHDIWRTISFSVRPQRT